MVKHDPITAARALLKAADASETDLEAAIAAVERHGGDADARLAGLRVARAGVVENGTRSALAAHDEKIADEGFTVEQSAAVAARLREALVPVAAAALAARIATERAVVEAQMEKAADALQAYPELVKRMRTIIGTIATADKAAVDFLAAHPGEPPIPLAESRIRHQREVRKVVEVERTWAWAFADGRLRDPAMPDRVIPIEGAPANRELLTNGEPRPGGFMGSKISTEWYERDWLAEIATTPRLRNSSFSWQIDRLWTRVWPVEVWEKTVEVTPEHLPEPLATAVRLPGLHRDDRGWHADSSHHASVLGSLTGPAKPGTPPRIEIVREQVVEGEPAPQVDVAA